MLRAPSTSCQFGEGSKAGGMQRQAGGHSSATSGATMWALPPHTSPQLRTPLSPLPSSPLPPPPLTSPFQHSHPAGVQLHGR